ncbi:hypothetical protein RSW36_25155 [Escherichia coli]|uniref:hypothetical protein n=1 Tax=Escherichia coli TaxID=562 RepID=UPI0028DECD04|nr:hypothetical protein [Escherichia coli]MDT9046441.1 hypothetical protein [Escherichia coli]
MTHEEWKQKFCEHVTKRTGYNGADMPQWAQAALEMAIEADGEPGSPEDAADEEISCWDE